MQQSDTYSYKGVEWGYVELFYLMNVKIKNIPLIFDFVTWKIYFCIYVCAEKWHFYLEKSVCPKFCKVLNAAEKNQATSQKSLT